MDYFRLASMYLLLWLSLFIFGLALFRLKLRNYAGQCILSIVLLTQISVLIQMYNQIYLLSIIQPLCLLLCLCFFFRIKLFHSILMVILAFGFNIIIESPVNLLLSKFDYSDFVEMSKNFYILPSIVICIINLSLSFLLNKFRIGFTFISSQRLYEGSSQYQKKLLWLALIGFVLIGITSLTIVYFEKIIMLSITLSLFIVGIIFHLSYLKEIVD